jgi:hypothetical protein
MDYCEDPARSCEHFNFHHYTSYDSFYKWTKTSSPEIYIFGLKMMVKSGLDFFFFEYFSEIPTNLLSQFSLSGQIILHWAAETLKGLAEF